MAFWLTILVGGLFVWLAVRMGFFETWTLLFNIVVSIYAAVFLTPVILEIIPAAGDPSYGAALTLLFAAVGPFLLLSGISYVFLTGQFKVSFPRTFEILFAGSLGFLTGFLVSSFISLALTITPLSRNSLLSTIGFNSASQRPNISYVCWWCDAVHSIVSMPDDPTTSVQIVDQLLNRAGANTPDKPAEPPPSKTKADQQENQMEP